MDDDAQSPSPGWGWRRSAARWEAPASSGWSLGSLWDSATSAVGSGASWLGEQASGAWEGAKGLGSDLCHGLTGGHFEGREARNGPAPSQEELSDTRSQWQLLPESMSIFHDNGEGSPEKKYINPDGREAVMDGDTNAPVTDPRYMPTYNCVKPMAWDNVHGLGDGPEFAGRNVGHFFAHVVPYRIGGNVRGER